MCAMRRTDEPRLAEVGRQHDDRTHHHARETLPGVLKMPPPSDAALWAVTADRLKAKEAAGRVGMKLASIPTSDQTPAF